MLASCEDFYDSLGDDGDPIPILPHSLQCAARLSEVAPDDDELIVAGLVHDIGHRLQPGHPVEHGMIAADAVRDLLGERVADARRAARAGEALSRHRRRRLPRRARARDRRRASPAKVARSTTPSGPQLERRPELADALTLRRADEAAKDPNAVVPVSTTGASLDGRLDRSGVSSDTDV